MDKRALRKLKTQSPWNCWILFDHPTRGFLCGSPYRVWEQPECYFMEIIEKDSGLRHLFFSTQMDLIIYRSLLNPKTTQVTSQGKFVNKLWEAFNNG